MAKTKKRSRARRYFTKAIHRAKKMQLSLAIVGGLMPGLTAIGTAATNGGWQVAGKVAGQIYTGYDYTTGKFSTKNMQVGLMPLAVGVIIHKIAGMIGINRAIASTGLPIIRI